MNAGFSNLATLKKHLLPANMQTSTALDAVITDLGLGVAAQIENLCCRKFFRAAATTEIVAADACQFLLNRFPVETVSKIELKLNEADGWVEKTVNDFVTTIDLASGIVNTPEGADAGPWYAQLRFTYTGGYFWETAEPTTEGYPTSVPSGAALLPADLKLAWLLQCRTVWDSIDKLGASVAETPKKVTAVETLELSPQVKAMLERFIRHQMT